MAKHEPSLPSNRAFVVQFRSPVHKTHGMSEGRVEHVVSGQASHFSSWKQLHAFIEQVLTRVAEKPP